MTHENSATKRAATLGAAHNAMSETRKTVLVVDDRPQNRYVICRILKQGNYNATEAANGDQALELAGRHTPDAIILDMNLPGESGIDILKRLRNQRTTAAIPVVFLSADSNSFFDRASAEEFGAQAYLFSPVEAETLLTVVGGIIENGRRR